MSSEIPELWSFSLAQEAPSPQQVRVKLALILSDS